MDLLLSSAQSRRSALGRRIIVVQVGARRHHRVDGVFLLDAEVDDAPCPSSARAASTAPATSLALGDAQPAQAVRLGQLDEVGALSGVAA